MILRDVDHICKLEHMCFDDPWDKFKISSRIKSNSIGFVVEEHTDISGYMIYDCYDRYYIISRINVLPQYRRDGIGTHLIDNVKNILTPRVNQIRVYVADENLELQMFLKRCSFETIKVVKLQNKEFYIFIFNR
jgi:ribosomal protein S18 acetylase RimI-like enzyme